MLPVPTEKRYGHELQAGGLRERTASLWVAAQRVQTLDEMVRAPPFAGPLGLCAHLPSLSLDVVNSGKRSKLSASRLRDPRTPAWNCDPLAVCVMRK